MNTWAVGEFDKLQDAIIKAGDEANDACRAVQNRLSPEQAVQAQIELNNARITMESVLHLLQIRKAAPTDLTRLVVADRIAKIKRHANAIRAL
jgi:hypothetical protein